MNLTSLHNAWLAQLAEQERATLLLVGAAVLVILTIALAEDRHRRWMLPTMAVMFGLSTVILVLFKLPSAGGIPLTQGLWYDEAFTWRVARLPFPRMMEALAGDVHPPLWYVIEWVTIRLFGESEVVLRLPALLFGVLGLWLVYRLGLALGYARKTSTLAAVLLAGLPGWIYYSQEARMYTLLACGVLVAVIGMYFYLVIEKGKREAIVIEFDSEEKAKDWVEENMLNDNLLDAYPFWTHFYSPYNTWLEEEFNISGSNLIDKQVTLPAVNQVNCEQETDCFWDDIDDWPDDLYLQFRLDM